ncbi:hypothetical protein C8F04DRAFT_1185152 [Mycena alexandri]|uniref:Uncharacterized protein n=1 Tax=Mycena alexandri TaxID=1745969 RepID=A0AAD6X4Y4_9AGAR|nr:hypothetical protein C8F04DRAFT_1185152 [Mycena alexandri]
MQGLQVLSVTRSYASVCVAYIVSRPLKLALPSTWLLTFSAHIFVQNIVLLGITQYMDSFPASDEFDNDSDSLPALDLVPSEYGLEDDSVDQFLNGTMTLCRPSAVFKPIRQHPALCFDILFAVVELLARDGAELKISEFVLRRGAIRLFWTRITLSPRIPLPFLEGCVARSASLPLRFLLVAVRRGDEQAVTYGEQRCDFRRYVKDSARLFFLVAESPYIVEDVFGTFRWTNPVYLNSIQTTFQFVHYHDFRPYSIRFIEFESLPPIGPPFRDFTKLSWVGTQVSKPTVTFDNSQEFVCVLQHPRNRPVVWEDATTVLTSSTILSVIILDGITFTSTAGSITCTYPFPALRYLALVFHGEHSMATLVSRFNLPAIHTLHVTLTDVDDVECLSIGVDLVYFYAFALASRRNTSLGTVNWLGSGYERLDYLSVDVPAGGRDSVVEDWIAAQGVTLNIVNIILPPCEYELSDREAVAYRFQIVAPQQSFQFGCLSLPCRSDRAILPRNNLKLRPASHCPFNLFIRILEDQLGEYFLNMDEFVDSPSRILAACVHWHDIALDNGQCWADYIVLPSNLLVDVRDRTYPLDIRDVDLRGYLNADHHYSVDDVAMSHGSVGLEETAREAAQYAHLCSRLHVSADGADALPAFVDGLRYSDGSKLIALSIALLEGSENCTSASNSLNHIIFNGALPKLKYIRLIGFVLSWTEMFYYLHAVYVVFHRVNQSSIIPKWTHCISYSHSTFSPAFFLRTSGCPIVGVFLPRLMELDICFCGDNIISFISTCTLPAIQNLSAIISKDSDLEQLLHFRSFLPSLYSVAIIGKHGNVRDIVQVFQLLPLVSRLNLSDAGPAYVEALTPGKSGVNGLLCPAVTVLSIGNCGVDDVIDLMTERTESGSSRIRVLNLHDLEDCNKDGEIWIELHVGELNMDPEFNFHDEWIWRC